MNFNNGQKTGNDFDYGVVGLDSFMTQVLEELERLPRRLPRSKKWPQEANCAPKRLWEAGEQARQILKSGRWRTAHFRCRPSTRSLGTLDGRQPWPPWRALPSKQSQFTTGAALGYEAMKITYSKGAVPGGQSPLLGNISEVWVCVWRWCKYHG